MLDPFHMVQIERLFKLFGQWQWAARPCQPKSRAPNGLGVIWEVQASSQPAHEVYQLQHADVLIAEITKQKQKEPPLAQDIQGSAKTIAALSSQPDVRPAHDPWDDGDPCGGDQTSAKTAKVHHGSLRPEQMESLVGKVTQRVLDQTKSRATPMEDGDTPRASDERFQSLEQRMTPLEQNLHAAQASQQQHNMEVANQIGHMQHQVDQQSATLTNHPDNKMAEQLAHIERLLLRRSEEE
jgi:hypothetical protein